MIEEEGKIIGFNGAKAVVKTKRTSACVRCASRDFCRSLSENRDMVVEVANLIDAKMNDRVIIAIEESALFKLSFLAYAVPVVLFVSGIFFGRLLAEGLFNGLYINLISTGTGFVFVSFSFFLLWLWGGKIKGDKRFEPVIVRKMDF